ncbi:MAG: glycerophosphodiester phosphodiesterase family protein [Parafilimonas sp.]
MRKLLIILFTFLFTCIVSAYNIINQNSYIRQSTPLPKTKHALVVIAHRGSHLNVPENTLAAYENAIKEGVDYIETDLRTTKDGHLVIMHDAAVSRMTGMQGQVKDLNYNDIKDLEIKPVVKGDTAAYHIPEFADVLNVCKGRINIYLDFKDADVKKTYRLLKDYGMQNNVVVYLNKEEQYEQWKKVAPQVPLMSSLPENADILQLNNFLAAKHLDVVDNAYTVNLVNLVHKRKIAVWLDVQREDEGPATWKQALKQGADGLQTDHPEKLIKYMESQGKR